MGSKLRTFIPQKTLAAITVAARTQDVPSWALQTVADAFKIMGSSSALCRRHFKVRSATACSSCQCAIRLLAGDSPS